MLGTLLRWRCLAPRACSWIRRGSGSPLHQFRTEVADGFRSLQEKLVAIEAAQQARAGERAKSAAKGGDFEAVLEAMLGEIARGANDLLERCGTDAGDAGRSKKGDFVLTLDPDLCRGSELRVVIEAKDRKVSGREMRDELRAAKTNRDAAAALVIFTPAHAPAGIAPFDVRAGDVYAVIDPADPDAATLQAAVRLARLLALTSLRENEAEVDLGEVQAALTAIRECPGGRPWPQGPADEHQHDLGRASRTASTSSARRCWPGFPEQSGSSRPERIALEPRAGLQSAHGCTGPPEAASVPTSNGSRRAVRSRFGA